MPDAILYRDVPLSLAKRAEGEDDNVLRFSASSEAPVKRWGDTEILRHDERSVRMDRIRSLGAVLVNHDAGQRAAAILEATLVDGRLQIVARFGSSDAAQQYKRDVLDGLLRGVSVGYRVHGWDVDEESRTYTATDWEPYEASFTPIPADASVGVGRSLPDVWQAARSINPPAASAANTMEVRVSDPAEPATPAPQPQAPAAVPTTHDEGARAAIIAEQREIVQMAESFGLRASDFAGQSKVDAQAAMLRALATQRATPAPAAPAAPTPAPAAVVADALDKQRDAFAAGFAARVGVEKPEQGNPYAGRSIGEMARIYARHAGIKGANDWSRKDAAHFVLGSISQIDGMRDAANIASNSFPSFVFLNAITKVVAKGYEAGSAGLIYPRISERNPVPDFRTASIGGMGTANLQETAENAAFPELAKSEGVFNVAAKMWGGTLSLTLQALVNDDTAQFERSLRQAGAIAAKTEEKRAIQKFLRGTATTDASTWTNNTTSGCTMVYATADQVAAARANIYKASIGMMNKVGADGNPLGTMPKFLLCGATNSIYARGILGGASGQIVANSGDLELLVTPWLENSVLTGFSTTTYYLLADPSLVTGLLHTVVTGFESIQVQEYDSGAVAARNWKLWKPFEFDLFGIANSAGTTVIPFAQQATT